MPLNTPSLALSKGSRMQAVTACAALSLSLRCMTAEMRPAAACSALDSLTPKRAKGDASAVLRRKMAR